MKARVIQNKAGPRVLYVFPGEPKAFNQIFTRRQLEALRNKGLDVEVCWFPKWTSLRTLAEGMKTLEWAIKGYQPHIVHAQYGTMTGFCARILTRQKFVVTFRGSDLNPGPAMGRSRWLLGHLLSQLAAARSTAVVCVSSQLAGRLWFGGRRAEIIPSGVDTGLFAPMDQKQARQALGWDTQNKVVLFNAGRDPLNKGLDLAQSALEQAKSRIPGLGLFSIHGGVDPADMPLYYNAVDCLLVASRFEGSPNVVKEALACNLPVVSVDVGDVKQRLAGVAPSAIADRTPQALGSALVRVLEQKRRSNGRGNAQEVSLEQTTDKLMRLYIRLHRDNA